MITKVLEQYFVLTCENKFGSQIEFLETNFSLAITEEYNYLINRYCFTDRFKLSTFFIDNRRFIGKRHYFTIGTIENITGVIELTSSIKEIEKRLIEEEPNFTGFDIDFCICIATLISRNSDLYEGLFLDCGNSQNRGSLCLIDLNLYYDLDDNGNPLKVKIADSITHLIEMIIEQQNDIPIEYRLS